MAAQVPPGTIEVVDERPACGRPRVSLVVAMRNERDAIERCIASLFAQSYPAERLEILVYDGASTDGSREIVERVLAGHSNGRLWPNPGIIQAAAWNLGISEATGDVIGIVSGHAELSHEYVSAAVAALEQTGAWMVGGPVTAIGEGLVGEAVALATSTPFGVGNARHHYARTAMDVDAVFMGVCRAETYRRFRFDESMVRDQDDELGYRILDAGGRIVCDPAIRSTYHSRATLQGLWRQYFAYGYWKVRVFRRHPRQIRLRQLVPSAFVLALIATTVSAPFSFMGRFGLAVVAGSYVLGDLVASLLAARNRQWHLLPVLSVVFATLHLAYGLGVLRGTTALFRRSGTR
jgi:glycosyltransferase involved in cell wall biosynthesis